MTNIPDTTAASTAAVRAWRFANDVQYYTDNKPTLNVEIDSAIAEAAIQAHNKAMREAVPEKEYPAPLTPEDRRRANDLNELRRLILGEDE